MARVPLASRLRSFHGWRRGVTLVVLVLVLVLVVAAVFVTRPQRLGRITAGWLAEATGAQVEVDRAYLSLDGGLQLEGVRFAVPELPTELARLGEIGSVRVTPDIWSLAEGKLRVRSIVLLEPTLYLTRDAEDERYNYQHLLKPSDEPGQQWLVDALPEIFIRGGRLRFAEVGQEGTRSLGAMGIEGRLIRDPAQPAGYAFTLHQRGEQLLPGVVLHGRLDLLRQRVATSLHGFQFTDEQRQLLPGPLRELWQQLDPAGEMPEITLRYDPATAHGLEAELRMRDVAMSIPAPGIDARVRHVTALLRLRGDRLSIASLTGEIEGIAYQIEGEINHSDLDAPMRLRLVTEPFTIDESPPPYLAGLPEIVHRHYARFQPIGRFQTTLELWRSEQGGQLEYDGTVNVLGAAGRFEKFPVPVHDLHGQVHLSHEQVRIENMRGRSPGGAPVHVEGTITPPGKQPEVDLLIHVRGGTVEQPLLAALKPDHRRIVDLFMHEPSRARLIEAGLVRDAPPALPQWRDRLRASLFGDGGPPMFAFIGRMDSEIHVRREAGPIDAKATVHLTPRGPVPLLFKHWPYPVYLTAGRVVIAPDDVRVEGVQLQGLTGGRARLAGHVRHDDGDAWPDLQIEHARLPIDPFLLAAVPQPQDAWVRQLGLTGELDGTGDITADDQGKTDFALTLRLAAGRANPYHGRFVLTDVDGELLLRRDSAELKRFTARRGAAPVTGQGALAWGDGERDVDLAFAGEGMTVETALLDLLPPDHPGRETGRKLFDRHQPAGEFDAELFFGEPAGSDATAFDDGAPPYRLVVRPRSLSLAVRDETFDLREMAGSVTVVGDQAELDSLAARFDAGRLTADGLVMLESAGGAALQLTGEVEDLAGSWTTLLPEPLTRTLEAMQTKGQAGIEHLRLVSRPRASEGPRFEAEGELTLQDTRLDVGVPVEELGGTLSFAVEHGAEDAFPQFDVQLDADRLIAQDREMTELAVALRSDREAQAIELEQIQGKVYGGMLVGSGLFNLDRDPVEYHVELELQEVGLDAFLAAPELRRQAEQAEAGGEPTPEPPANDDPGQLNASLDLRGRIDEPDSRRGRGALTIQQARLYQRPVMLALLQAVNLSLPLSGSFDRGAASFLVQGETVYFDDLTLEAPSVAIHGDGTMHYPTGELDLSLRGRNPAGPDLGVVSDVFNLVKDQLVAIRITGTLEEPDAQVIGMQDLRQPWRDAFDDE